ncbi:MAG: nucleosidase [Pseudomonadota bacterium]
MHNGGMHTPTPFIAPEVFDNADAALRRVQAIYTQSVQHLRSAMQRFVGGDDLQGRVRACYPYVRLDTATGWMPPEDAETELLSYGFVASAGSYATTITRPDLFAHYLREQFALLIHNHGVKLEVGTSKEPMPVHFSFAENEHMEGEMSAARRARMRDVFDLPDLTAMDDSIANGTWRSAQGQPQPLSLFTGARTDYSLHRLRHYSGTSPAYFQNYVLFTNYQFYIDEFIALGHAEMAKEGSPYVAFVEPGNVVTRRVGLPAHADDSLGIAPPRLPQMPAYHLVREDHSGITMVNIGVGPANAKNITDHIAVLRPHAWLMVGHCAGLRTTDEELPLWVPIPALAEIQVALERAVSEVTGSHGAELKRLMRTGTVASTDNRNWELLPDNTPQRRFSQSRAVALDMESATIAANGFRFRVPYGTLLCVSDKPLHGEIKLPGMANHFYRERVNQHLQIGIRALELLRTAGPAQLHSRKLRSFAEVAFQ